MPFSHHSHSGQFCAHAQDNLENVVKAAIARKMQILALTEHMPREQQDLYPEEASVSQSLTVSKTYGVRLLVALPKRDSWKPFANSMLKPAEFSKLIWQT